MTPTGVLNPLIEAAPVKAGGVVVVVWPPVGEPELEPEPELVTVGVELVVGPELEEVDRVVAKVVELDDLEVVLELPEPVLELPQEVAPL
jgi:hypothetical protein